MNEIDILSEISKKLDRLIALTAIDGKERDNQISILSSLGYTNVEISIFTGIPKGTVDVIRAKQNKEKNGKRSNNKKA